MFVQLYVVDVFHAISVRCLYRIPSYEMLKVIDHPEISNSIETKECLPRVGTKILEERASVVVENWVLSVLTFQDFHFSVIVDGVDTIDLFFYCFGFQLLCLI